MKNFDKKSVFTLIIDFVIIVGAVLVRIFAPVLMGILPECPFAASGIPCGSCGGTRCVYNFFQGHFIKAFEYNQFFFFVIIFVLALLLVLNLSWFFKIKRAEKILSVMANYKVVIFIAVLYAVFTVVRIIILRN